MATAKASKTPYNDNVAALIELDPPIFTRDKLTAIVTAKIDGSKEICRNH